MFLKKSIYALATIITINGGGVAFAQGQDGTPSERNIMIVDRMLPGYYDNANQAYFDRRLKKVDGAVHRRMGLTIERVEAENFSDRSFVAIFEGEDEADIAPTRALLALEVDNKAEAVRMKTYLLGPLPKKRLRKKDAVYTEGCDILWREEAGQFRGVLETPGVCSVDGDTPPHILISEYLLSEDALWLSVWQGNQSHFVLERARNFSCYVDVPGVGGGRDIPFKRYQIEKTHDKGGKSWITLDDGSELSVTLQNIHWPMNNEKDVFTRHSFVLYIGTRKDDEIKEVSYTWTEPNAQRIGINLKWMLANCYMLSNREVTPFFKDEPRL